MTAMSLCAAFATTAHAQGEPAKAFLDQLRAAGYFDTAITYLERLDEYPGVAAEVSDAIPLEKAQTYIDAAVAASTTSERDQQFSRAESALESFLEQGSHPRAAEARLQLGKLQMVRAAQLMSGDVDDEERTAARQSYISAAETFEAIVKEIREKLLAMRGQRVDASQEPAKAQQRDQYRYDFLQAQLSAGEARLLAAETHEDPASEGKELLDQSLVRFDELTEKYDDYVQGAMALFHRGRVMQLLGQSDQAADSYLRMLETPDADPLRESKLRAAAGLIDVWLSQTPPKIQPAIDRGQAMLDTVRPDEKQLPAAQDLRISLAKAYQRKAAAKDDFPAAEIKRAKADARQLLVEANKIPGLREDEVQKLLAEIGIETEEDPLPVSEDPKSFEDALMSARQLMQTSETLQSSLAALEQQTSSSESANSELQDLRQQLTETRQITIQMLRRGLAMANSGVEIEQLHQAQQYLAYTLYQTGRWREAAVVGSFLARTAAGTKDGLRGGLLALTSLQKLIAESPQQVNAGLIDQVRSLGEFLAATWPNDPQAAAAQGVMIRLALKSERWDEARQLISDTPPGPEKASFQRLLGQLNWNRSIQARQDNNSEQAAELLLTAQQNLQQGLDSIEGNLVAPDAMQASLILAKTYLRSGDPAAAVKTLDHPKYGPIELLEKFDPPSDRFKSDLYQTELQAVVGQLTSAEGNAGDNTDAMLARATQAMENVRASVQGDDAQPRLVATYMSLAREIREQLEQVPANRRAELVDAFRVFLERIAESTDDAATLQWVGNTMMQMGEASMLPTDIKATGEAAELLKTAEETFENLLAKKPQQNELTLKFQLGKTRRLLGDYSAAINVLEEVLVEKPMMLDAQTEAALAYEKWAAVVEPRHTADAYEAALLGARPGPDGENTIWGWGKISQLTSRDKKFREIFFDARYHVALSRYLMGKAEDKPQIIQQAVKDITSVAALYPEMGGDQQKAKFNSLLKEIQRAAGEPAAGLP